MIYRTDSRELDVGTRTISNDGVIVHTEPQVFDLIVYLIENRARVVGKDELLARIWKGRVVSDASIASRINAARKAFGDDGRKQNVIATQSRQGFRWVAQVTAEGHILGRPSVAVMPFLLLTDGTSATHLARGLADQLASTLGRAAWFDVCDTAASFAPHLEGLSPDKIADELGIGYLVMGSLQVLGGKLKLSVRLTDPENNHQVWSSAYSGTLDDVFDIQDKIANNILGELEPVLRQTELQRSKERHGNFTAFDHYLRAAEALRPLDLAAMDAACAELDLAVAVHPGYGAAKAMRAWIATLMVPQGRRVDEKTERVRCRQALEQSGYDCNALAMGGYALGYFERDPETGIGYLRRALAVNPSSARAHDHLGWLLLYSGQADEAKKHFDRGLALSPIDEYSFRMLTGHAFADLFLRRFEASVKYARRAHTAAPSYTVCHRVLTAALAHLGHAAEAQSVLQELLTINPGTRINRYARETRFEGTSDRELLLGGLKRAGMT